MGGENWENAENYLKKLLSLHRLTAIDILFFRVEHPRVVLRKGHVGVCFYFIFSGSVFVNVEELLTKTGHVMWHTAITLHRGDSFGVDRQQSPCGAKCAQIYFGEQSLFLEANWVWSVIVFLQNLSPNTFCATWNLLRLNVIEWLSVRRASFINNVNNHNNKKQIGRWRMNTGLALG